MNTIQQTEKLPKNMLEMQIYWEKKRQREKWSNFDPRSIESEFREIKPKVTKERKGSGYFATRRRDFLRKVQKHCRENNIYKTSFSQWIDVLQIFSTQDRRTLGAMVWHGYNSGYLIRTEEKGVDLTIFLEMDFDKRICDEVARIKKLYDF